MLRHALNMIQPRPRQRGRPSFNRTRASARALGLALMENPRFGSSSSECDAGPSNLVDHDPEYCDEQAQKSCLSVTSMRKILELRANGRLHAALKRFFPKYGQRRLSLYMRRVQQGKPTVNRLRQINEGVLERVSEARAEGKPVHGNHIRR